MFAQPHRLETLICRGLSWIFGYYGCNPLYRWVEMVYIYAFGSWWAWLLESSYLFGRQDSKIVARITTGMILQIRTRFLNSHKLATWIVWLWLTAWVHVKQMIMRENDAQFEKLLVTMKELMKYLLLISLCPVHSKCTLDWTLPSSSFAYIESREHLLAPFSNRRTKEGGGESSTRLASRSHFWSDIDQWNVNQVWLSLQRLEIY